MRFKRFLLFLMASIWVINYSAMAKSADLPWAQQIKGLKASPGFIPFYTQVKSGRIWLEIGQWNREFLYITSLRTGLGSTSIGLDRNQLGGTKLVKWQRVGSKVFLVQPNYNFRAISGTEAERKVVQESFADSIIWGFEIVAEEGQRVWVEATDFFLRDSHGLVSRLSRRTQARYVLDRNRSAILIDQCKNFPRNTEVEVLLTVTSSQPAGGLRWVTPDAAAISFQVHHSFVALPEEGYRPRQYDPRSSFMAIRVVDFSAPLGASLVQRYICRHRLSKKDPTARVSDPVKPLIYYVDPGIPEPIRSAVIEGASWWNEAFTAIGYRNAFQVKILPEGADPLDIRYNVINWVHRQSRSWSYGGAVIDPRTGEIIKGHVTLGSLRIRQDYLIAQSLVGNFTQEKDNSALLKQMALARIRQLACHEVGHTLGLVHNYASSVNDRASVMDYPHPLIKLNSQGKIDLAEAYATGIGEWDKVSIAYGYQDFPPGVDETKALQAILTTAFQRGLLYLSDRDATAPGAAHPLAHQWDNGVDPVKELARVMEIRKVALQNFSAKRIPWGSPLALLEDILVPVYFFHRYQVEAAVKVLAGLNYAHKIRGDSLPLPEMVNPEWQRQALEMLLQTIQPEFLFVPDHIWRIIPPRPSGWERTRDSFAGRTGPTFDSLGAAEAAANLTLSVLFNPQRACRLVEYHSRNSQSPGLGEVIDRVLAVTWKKETPSAPLAEVKRVVDDVVLYHLFRLALDEGVLPQVRAVASLKLKQLKEWLAEVLPQTRNEETKAHWLAAWRQLDIFEKNPDQLKLSPPLSPPPGAPI